MTIRVFSPSFPYPPDEGNFLTVYDQIVTLAEAHSVVVYSWLDDLTEYERRRKRKGIVALDERVTWRHLGEQNRRCGPDKRWRRLLSLFLSSTPSSESFWYPAWAFEQRRNLPPVDLEIYHHTMSFPWLSRLPNHPDQRRVCMVHDCSSELYKDRSESIGNSALKWFYRRNSQLIERHEATLHKHCDELWFVTPIEEESFRRRGWAGKTRTTPPTFSRALARQRRLEFRESKSQPEGLKFGLLGGLVHAPNLESLRYVLKELCPRLKAAGFQGEIQVVGKGAPDDVVEESKKFPFVSMLGFIEDLTEFWSQLSGMLVPHVMGTGIRMKLLEALAYGVPALANQAVIRRLHVDLQGSPLLVPCETSDDWVREMGDVSLLELRRQQSFEELPMGLSGRHVYSFLVEDSTRPSTS